MEDNPNNILHGNTMVMKDGDGPSVRTVLTIRFKTTSLLQDFKFNLIRSLPKLPLAILNHKKGNLPLLVHCQVRYFGSHSNHRIQRYEEYLRPPKVFWNGDNLWIT